MENKKILVVEDDQDLSTALREEISKAGFEVLVASNGKDGLSIAFKVNPDLILTDIIMPVMDGMEMVRRLREDEWGSKVPLIVLTNLNDEEKVADFLEKGAFDYLVKTNWRLDEVVARIREKLHIKE